MKTKLIIYTLLITLATTNIINYKPNLEFTKMEINSKIDERDRYLWDTTVKKYLTDDLWTDRDIYDAGHCLMVPLHASFYLKEEKWQIEFSNHFRRFIEANHKKENNISGGRLNRLHYLYLASRFVVLAQEAGKPELIPSELTDLIYEEIEKIWIKEPAWQWDRQSFNGGIRERILWKLENKNVDKSYYRAIIDEELFTFAITADLRTYERLTKPKKQWSIVLTDILEIAYKTFEQEGKLQSEGGWLFQPGVWRDHPDYAFAGQTMKKIGMKSYPISNIAMDTSHSHRFPLWLTSLETAYENGCPEKEFYLNIKRELEQQFINKVLVYPTKNFAAYRTKNFMDGSNGVYRWQYSTTAKDGYGPYELSGTLTLGWWVFLNTDRIKNVYKYMSLCYPLPKNVIRIYMGPNTTRERNPYVKWPEFLNNGYSELISRLASKLP